MIREVIVTTLNEDSSVHIAPMGISIGNECVSISPFRPSLTLENIKRNKTAVVNFIDDVRIFAGCLTGHDNWTYVSTSKIKGKYLELALTHVELKMDSYKDDEIRPTFCMKVVFEQDHSPFRGFNRAQAAVLEAAILVSRLSRLSKEKINQEVAYLSIAIDKTAGENEKIAWQWLMKKIKDYYKS